jgi:xanthine/uracil permease
MTILKKYRLTIIGFLVGAVGGYLYYYFVGCSTGTCPITSNPWRMTLYGSLMGMLLFDMFRKEPEKSKNDIDSNK